MDPSCYPQSSSLPSRRLGSPLPDTRNSAYEPRPSLVDYSCSPPFHYPYCGHPLDPLPTLYTAVSYSPVNISPVGDDRHPFAEEQYLLVNNSPSPTGISSEQPQHACPSYAVTQTAQSGTVGNNGTAEERAEAEPLRPTISRKLIRQEPYKPATRQTEFADSSPIEFIVNGKEGISLSDALEGNVAGLEGRDDRSLFEGNRPQIIIRLQPVGCSRWYKKINTMDFTAKSRPIPRAKLAAQIAKSVEKFIEREKRTHNQCIWGEISLENTVLTRISRVSVASWQPEIFVEYASGLPSTSGPSPSSSGSCT